MSLYQISMNTAGEYELTYCINQDDTYVKIIVDLKREDNVLKINNIIDIVPTSI